MSKNDLNHEHVRNGISNGLVDEVSNSGQGLQSILLSGRLRLLLAEDAEGLLGEDYSSMAVGLEVNTDIELARSMVKVFDASGCANDGELKVLLDVGSASTVGIGCLNDTYPEVVLKSSRANEVTDERGIQGGDTVAVEHEETSVGVNPVVNQTVSITVKRAASHARDGLGAGRSSLFGLDKIGTALQE
jgi:hypothetical protein